MPAQDALWQQQIVREVGDPNGTIDTLVPEIWPLYADLLPIHPRLQMLYTKRAALDARLAEEEGGFDFEDGQVRFARSQTFTHLMHMRTETQAEIVRIEEVALASRGPRQGALSTTAPTAPPFPDSADANDPRYAGSPYRPNLPW